MAEITFTGNVGKEPDFEFTQSGRAKLTFSVADSKSKPDGNGGWEKLAEQWLRVTVWGPYAEHLSEQVAKGSRVKIYGEFYAREYEAKDGSKGVSLDVTADGVKIYPPKNGQSQPAASSRKTPNQGNWGGGNTQSGNNVPGQDPWASQPAGSGWGSAPADSEPPF
ncbi:single-stranded DNA-binding protein [Arthrobacter bambusae]|uniref:single-stranded DNA-binding protein n=1 Tax=Arthrobacter bambusae TaxID=1338426 RepID=UPI002787AE4E|nr:single-stranded DNA-binding protein [Arthrobacter bambusae]MDQ0241224.1 single-strand DNA-binding protein [Arthrobacter bambusae]